jgi:riboflavin transporter FmnP
MTFIAPGVLAGLVSAILISLIGIGTGFGLMLYLLAPIPVIVVTLAFDHRSGLVAGVMGAVAVAMVQGGITNGFGYLLTTALPAWWLAYLALLSRPKADGTTEWYPLGRLLAWIAGTGTLIFFGSIILPGFDFATYRENTREMAEMVLRAQTGTPETAPLPDFGDVAGEDLAARLAGALPLFAGQGFTLVLTFYMWISARIVSASGRLQRPWPQISRTIMPREALYTLFATSLVAIFLDGFTGVVAITLTGALLMAFALQGLAAIHEMSEGRSGRPFILILAYLLILLSQGLIFLPLIMFGLTDTALGIRERMRANNQGRNGGGPPLS